MRWGTRNSIQINPVLERRPAVRRVFYLDAERQPAGAAARAVHGDKDLLALVFGQFGLIEEVGDVALERQMRGIGAEADPLVDAGRVLGCFALLHCPMIRERPTSNKGCG